MNTGLNNAYATEASANTQVKMNVDSVINIAAPTTATLNCTPGATAASATLCTTTATIGVSTNNLTGYTLQMNATSGSSNALTNTAASPAATIPTLTQSYTTANFPTNYWGYTGGLDKSSETGGYNCTGTGSSSTDNYCPILAYESTSSNYAPNHIIKETSAPATISNTNITFASKVDISKPSGTYSTSVTFTAVTNYVPQPIVNGMNMQDIDSSVCAATPLYSESSTIYTVVDSRDQTNYTVAKLADGNCWMTQNLALGGSTPMTLTPDDTNIASNFTLPASVAYGSWSGSSDNPELYSSNLYWTGEICNEYDLETDTYDACPSGNPPTSSTGTQSYHLGNFYNWPAATAGSGTSATTSGDVAYSICPKNWRLPRAGTGYASSEQYIMINSYIQSGQWDDSDPDWPYWHNVTTSDFTNAPASLVFSGFYNGYLNHQGYDGYWWSSTAYDSDGAHGLYADSYGNVDPHGNNSKIYGYSVRCLVPGS